MNRTFKDILINYKNNCISPYGNELTIPLYLVCKDTGKLTVCERPKLYDYRKYNVDYYFNIHTNKPSYSFKINERNINDSKLKRTRPYGYYKQYEEITHYLFVDKEEAITYSNSILSSKIEILQREMNKNIILKNEQR